MLIIHFIVGNAIRVYMVHWVWIWWGRQALFLFGHRDMATTVVVKTVQEENMKRKSLR